MDFLYISREVKFMLEGNEELRFLKYSMKSPIIPSEEQLRKKVLGIELSYSFYRNQDDTILRLKKSFGISRKGVIKKIPERFIIETIQDVIILKCGYTEISSGMISLTNKVGVTGYWDNANIIICVSKKYEQLFKSIQDLFECNKAKIEINSDSWGPNLRIVSL